VNPSAGQKDKQRVLNRDCGEGEGEQLSPLCADWCVVWHCRAVGGLDSSSCLAKHFKFVVLTSFMSAHITLN
jgi:hypothetical protein